MIIFGRWKNDFFRETLQLNAYSFVVKELNAFDRIVSDIGSSTAQVANDQSGRMGRRAEMPTTLVSSLEDKVGLDFYNAEGRLLVLPRWMTRVAPSSSRRYQPDLILSYAQEAGESEYCCRELDKNGDGDDAVPISAADDDSALFACALIGGQRHWFGSKPTRGSC